jgi:tetratricopeptide (TPR) repeat protein/DNA-binding CsgD family transcriptional regulator/transcriptional regulator with XRE-family HTH domain
MPRIFPRRGRVHKPSELVGRDHELTVLRAFVDEVSVQGGALLLSGEPGVGKSALLDAAAELAATAGLRVLRAAGADFEDESFSGLNQLLLPLRGDLDRLDDLQRHALNVALGFSDERARDQLVVSNAVLALLREAAADRPLLLAVDNLQWVDRASALVLGFVARRLSGSQIGFISTERTVASRLSDLDITGHEVAPLDDDASVRLVATRFPELAPSVRRRIVTEARGNPLALLELPTALSDSQRSAHTALPAVLPLGGRLRALLSSRISALPAATRYLLLLAVLEGTGNLSLVGAAAMPQCEIDDLAPAEQAGLVHVDEAPGRVNFAHPLIRSAVMELSPSSHVRRAHQALAAQLRDQPERRAWHLAGAAIEPDQAVASQLEQMARQACDRGHADQAVTALLRAAQLSPLGRDRGRLLAQAAYLSATVTGELPLVAGLLTEARRAASEAGGSLGPDGSLHAAVAEANLLLNGANDVEEVHRLLTRAIGAWSAVPKTDGTVLIAALQTLLRVCADGGRPELWKPFEAALASLVPGGCAELELLARTHADPARSAGGILSKLDAAIAELPRETGHWRTLVLGAAAARTDRLGGCRDALWQMARDGRKGGAVLPAISALTLLCLDGLLTGAWDEAWQLGEECLQACQSNGHPALAWPAREQLAIIAAARGDDDLVRELTGEMLRWAMPRGITVAQTAVHRAGTLAALGRGDFEQAYREAAAISPPGVLSSHVPHALWTVLDLVEAAVRTGRQQEAAAHVAAVRAARIAEISPRLALLVAASAALTAPPDQAGRLFEQALGIPGADRWPFDFARVQLAFGEHLRRVRAIGDARVPLGAALATFRTLGARPWAERAANELRATNITVTSTDDHRPAVLTAQELQIASLAAAGLTNKQIGQRLFLSPRTVGGHLYHVFPKLGVSSRAGLRDALTVLASGDTARGAAALPAAMHVLKLPRLARWRCSPAIGRILLSASWLAGGAVVAEAPDTFAGVLRRLRTGIQLTQEELARAANLSVRAVSDLERGVVTTPHRDTVRLLADALQLMGPVRTEFEAAARGPGAADRAVAPGVAAATRTLPRDVVSFTGREQELQELIGVVQSAAGVVSICAIGGMAGVGKTALAVHAAHRLAERFPTGQIFLTLHGHTPGKRPVDPSDALASLLLTIGVPAGQVPAGLEARIALWRDKLVNRRLLLVLDDAVNSEQVLPLLPGAGRSLILVTSRRHLTALEDATSISLDTLAPGEAAALLVRLAARPGLSPDDAAVSEVVRLCGYLPLAIGMLARQLHHHPAWSLAGQAAQLAAQRDRLELMATENVSVAAAFDLSYEDLAPSQQLLFRRLALHPGTEFDGYAAAALDGTDLASARRGLEILYDQYLLTEVAQGRYRMHDLIRQHARALADRLDPGHEQERAISRMLDYYQHTAALAESQIARRTVPAVAAPATSTSAPLLDGREQALAWARAERASLLACLDHAVTTDQHARVIALTTGLAGLLRHDGPWAEALTRHATAVRAAQRLGDRLAQANVLTDLGRFRLLTDDFAGAARDLAEALDIYRDVGNRLGQANVLNNLGDMRRLIGDYPAATRDLEDALDIYRDLGDRLGQANVLTNLGIVRRLTGDYPAATVNLTEALGIYRELGDHPGQTMALNKLGLIRRGSGDYAGAARDLEEALSLSRDTSDRLDLANALTYLGAVRRLTGDLDGAARDLEEGLIIYREIGNRSAEAEALNEAGTLYRIRGDLDRATSCHQEALDVASEVGIAWDEAHALAGLGRCALSAGRPAEAVGRLRQALEIFRRIGAAEAAKVAAELEALPR